MSTDVRQFTVDAEDDGIRLDRWFKRHLPDANFNTVSRWARTGQLRVDGKRATPGDRIEAGQQIRVPPADPVTTSSAKPKKERPRLSDDQIAQRYLCALRFWWRCDWVGVSCAVPAMISWFACLQIQSPRLMASIILQSP